MSSDIDVLLEHLPQELVNALTYILVRGERNALLATLRQRQQPQLPPRPPLSRPPQPPLDRPTFTKRNRRLSELARQRDRTKLRNAFRESRGSVQQRPAPVRYKSFGDIRQKCLDALVEGTIDVPGADGQFQRKTLRDASPMVSADMERAVSMLRDVYRHNNPEGTCLCAKNIWSSCIMITNPMP